jgi:hypothetical protein
MHRRHHGRAALVGLAIFASLVAASGCDTTQPRKRTLDELEMFGPSSMRIHPIFTQVKDWNGDAKPDGIEAEVEFLDRVQDPTKAAGIVIFELYSYRRAAPDPRGDRLVNPWIGSIATEAEQKARWNRTSRTYSFQLAYPQIHFGTTYVLTAAFESTGGQRLFDRTILQSAQQPARPAAQPTPAPAPATRPSSSNEPSTAPAGGGGPTTRVPEP